MSKNKISVEGIPTAKEIKENIELLKYYFDSGKITRDEYLKKMKDFDNSLKKHKLAQEVLDYKAHKKFINDSVVDSEIRKDLTDRIKEMGPENVDVEPKNKKLKVFRKTREYEKNFEDITKGKSPENKALLKDKLKKIKEAIHREAREPLRKGFKASSKGKSVGTSLSRVHKLKELAGKAAKVGSKGLKALPLVGTLAGIATAMKTGDVSAALPMGAELDPLGGEGISDRPPIDPREINRQILEEREAEEERKKFRELYPDPKPEDLRKLMLQRMASKKYRGE